jgi:hypothetical protein
LLGLQLLHLQLLLLKPQALPGLPTFDIAWIGRTDPIAGVGFVIS